MYQDIFNEIKKYETIIIHRHNNPDGDALGSQIGLKHILRANFPQKHVFAVGDGAGRYGFIDDSVMDQVPDSAFENALCIILDCGAAFLVSDDRYTKAAKTARIDHHMYSGAFTDLEVIDSQAESCCGEITQMAMELGLSVPPVAAKALYTGMVTDSGRFRYDSTTSDTHKRAAFLLEQGFDLNDVFLNLYSEDFKEKQLKAQYLLKIKFTPNNVAYIYTTEAELKSLNVDTFTISRGMVNTMADIKGVDIWVNFTESDGKVLCEIRSSRRTVNHIAVKYGGGGHAKACGATVASRDEAMAMLSDLDKMMQE